MHKKIYGGICGLRSIAALGIIAVHVAKNTDYQIYDLWYTVGVCQLESFVNLFFVISAFAMCCGYYGKIKEGSISLEEFYKKRYSKIWPFFSVLVCLDMVYSWDGIKTLADGFADLTLCFAFLPSPNISIVGVGWTLGVIFAFYILFPFFVFLLWNTKRAWFVLILSIIFAIFKDYFFANNDSYVLCNILSWSLYFVVGGIIYLYKDKLITFVRKARYVWLILCWISFIMWFVLPAEYAGIDLFSIKTVICCFQWIVYAISIDSRVLDNKITNFMSDVSLEIYLIHMFAYRVCEKMQLTTILGITNMWSFIIAYILVVLLAVILAYCVKNGLLILRGKIAKEVK